MDSEIAPPAALSVTAPPAPVVKGAAGRRRPGRKHDVAPSLILLLRSQPADRFAEDTEDADDPLGALKGVMLAVALSIPLWAIITMGVMFVMR